MTDPMRDEVFDQLQRVIAEEIDAQQGVERPIEAMPPLIADAVLDSFDLTLKPGVHLRSAE